MHITTFFDLIYYETLQVSSIKQMTEQLEFSQYFYNKNCKIKEFLSLKND